MALYGIVLSESPCMSNIEKLIWTSDGGLPKPMSGEAATGLIVASPNEVIFFRIVQMVLCKESTSTGYLQGGAP